MTKPVLLPSETHPITVTPTGGRVVVSLGDRVLADSTRALTLQEASYPAVQYLPLDDADPAVLERTEHTTYCPFKGDAGYFSVVTDGGVLENSVWFYEKPHDAVAEIAGHIAFYANKVDVRLDVTE
ncbi:MAG: COGs COG2343 [uncultured Acidimicrobiales bacterium]|uniref:COGs COG2343 n=1 Tax=uncultured Acidimicrobiales bacterium TaxID=310071 RepID=A0A6J4HB67_9ACTN|nr:MAG: COGs COG2343 [uncultured Acidimicrobiales bacterium]